MKDNVKNFAPPPDADDPRTPFQRFESFAKRLFSVPKSEIDEQQAKQQQERESERNGHKETA